MFKIPSENFLFYHCALLGRYREVIPEQIFFLRKLNIFYQMNVVVSCLGEDPSFLKFLLKDLPYEFIYHGSDVNLFEFPTLEVLQQKCIKSKSLILVGYIHSKGVSHFRGDQSGFSLEEIDQWRRDMMNFSISNFSIIKMLLKGCDVCGWDWINRNDSRRDFLMSHGIMSKNLKGFFGGNFWWTTNKYIKTLPLIKNLNWKQRCEAEVWIGRTSLSFARYFCSKKHKIFNEKN